MRPFLSQSIRALIQKVVINNNDEVFNLWFMTHRQKFLIDIDSLWLETIQLLSQLTISRNIFYILIPKINNKKILKSVMFMSFQIVMETMTKQDKDSNIRNKLNIMMKHFDFFKMRSRFIEYNTWAAALRTLRSLI